EGEQEVRRLERLEQAGEGRQGAGRGRGEGRGGAAGREVELADGDARDVAAGDEADAAAGGLDLGLGRAGDVAADGAALGALRAEKVRDGAQLRGEAAAAVEVLGGEVRRLLDELGGRGRAVDALGPQARDGGRLVQPGRLQALVGVERLAHGAHARL